MTLDFVKEGSKYIASWSEAPAGKFVFQVARTAKGYFTIYAGIGDMQPQSIFVEPTSGHKDFIIEVDVPATLNLIFESESEVIEAQYVEAE